MFKVGAEYEIRMIEGGDEVSFVRTIQRYEHPLIKLADTPPIEGLTTETIPGEIINVTSPNFISAVIKLR